MSHKLYYRTGELRYEGYLSPRDASGYREPKGQGVMYYKSGKVFREGIFQHGGLLQGKEYYPSGNLKFEGRYNDRNINGGYYGPTYPVWGKFYGDDGMLVYEGPFKVERQGSVGFPKVVEPEGFGSLE